jgi:hypothetical protein
MLSATVMSYSKMEKVCSDQKTSPLEKFQRKLPVLPSFCASAKYCA